MPHNELRHCVYCRRAERKGEPSVIQCEEDEFVVSCATCKADGSHERTSEEAEAAWNVNTAIISDAEQGLENMKTLVLVSEEWKDRAIASMELSSDLSKIIKDAVDFMQDRAAKTSKKHMDDPRHRE